MPQWVATGLSCVLHQKVRVPRIYNLIAIEPYGNYELRLCVQEKGLSVYSFSFGTCEIPQNGDRLRTVKEAS